MTALQPVQCFATLGLGAVRQALTRCLQTATFDGNPLRVNPWFADVWAPPCAFVGATRVLFRDFNYDGLTTATVGVRLVVPATALRPAQLDLETILDAFYGALQSDTTLSGTVKRVLAIDAQPVLVSHGSQDLPAYDCETRLILS